MFDSGISAGVLIDSIEKEADIAMPVTVTSYISWLTALEQLLYGEIIKEQGKIELDNVSGTMIDMGALPVQPGEDGIRFEDIRAVYADATQLIKSTAASGVIFPDTFYKIQNCVGLNLVKEPRKLIIIYNVRPTQKTIDNYRKTNVMLPIEFIELAAAKLRGEAYKAANEDSLAAKWLNDYNIMLENFKAWVSGKQAEFGL